MTADNAGRSLQQEIEEAMRKHAGRIKRWLDTFPEGVFSFAEVRHDPPWHIIRGTWQDHSGCVNPRDVKRGEYHLNVSLCGKEQGRPRSWPDGNCDICSHCIVAAQVVLARLAAQ